MIYELRVYHCVPGRLPDLIKRFDTLTLPLWEKHRIRQAGFWTVAIGPSNQDLYYMLNGSRWTNDAKHSPAFQADPDWVSEPRRDRKERPDRRVDHQHDPAADQLFIGKVEARNRHALRTARLSLRAGPPAGPSQALRHDHLGDLEAARHRTGRASGPRRSANSNQALYYLLKWESLADREKKWNAFQADPEWHAKRAETEKNGAIVARVENSILQPTNFSAVK